MKNPLGPGEWELMAPFYAPCRMLELGNKKRRGVGTYKEFFEAMGVEHVSIDINGQDGALPLDLTKRLNLRELGKFHVVTNFGVSEHLSDQKNAWENMHRALRTGGHLICVTPLPGDWYWHGEWYPTESFYEELAALNDYEVEALYSGNTPPNRLIYFKGRKNSSKKFAMPDESLLYRNKHRPRELRL